MFLLFSRAASASAVHAHRRTRQSVAPLASILGQHLRAWYSSRITFHADPQPSGRVRAYGGTAGGGTPPPQQQLGNDGQPPSIGSLYDLYVLQKSTAEVPFSQAAAHALLRPIPSRLQADLAPVDADQLYDLRRLGYADLTPFSSNSAALMIRCARTLFQWRWRLEEADESKQRSRKKRRAAAAQEACQVPGAADGQLEIIHVLRTQRGSPRHASARGFGPDVEALIAAARDDNSVDLRQLNRMDACSYILELLQAHAMAAPPPPLLVDRLRELGLASQAPLTTGTLISHESCA